VRLKGVTGRTVVGCLVAAALAFAALALAGHARAGAAVALGLLLGSLNGAAAERALSSGVGPRLSSIPRLAILTVAAIGIGLLLGTTYAWLVVLGVAAAQGILVAVAAKSLLNR